MLCIYPVTRGIILTLTLLYLGLSVLTSVTNSFSWNHRWCTWIRKRFILSLAVYWWAMLVVHWRALNTVGMTLCAGLAFLCVFDFAETSIHIYMTQSKGLICVVLTFVCQPTPLDWCSERVVQTDFMDVHQFYFWIPVCTVWRAEESSNAFTHLVMHRRPLTAADAQILFYHPLPFTLRDSPIWLPFHVCFTR